METTDFVDDEEIFNQFEVILSKVPASNITELNVNGVIFIFKNGNRFYIEWRPNENVVEITAADEESVDSQESDWSFVNQIVYKPAIDSIALLSPKAKNFRIPLSDLKKMKVDKSELRLYNHSDENFVNCIFGRSRPTSFIRALESQRVLKQSRTDPDVYICMDPDHEKLQKSFAELNLEEIRNSKSRAHPWASTGLDLLNRLAAVPQQVLRKDPNIIYNHNHYRKREFVDTEPEPEREPENNKKKVEIEPEKKDESKKIVDDPLPPRTLFKRELPLSEKQWREFITEDGRVSDPDRIKEIIFRGGVLPEVRQEVWKYLLGYDVWEHSKVEREQRRQELEREYFVMENQWKSLSKQQEKHFAAFRDRKCQAEKDVKRTDRCHEFFMGDDNPNLDKLQDILLTYIMYNFDVGYVQGMSDLLSPILCLMEDKAVSFWCFVGFMDKVFQNFDEDQAGMKKQLDTMRTLMDFSNPRLFRYFREHESDNMYFCFRWLLVWYKREFNSADIMELWEVLWTGLPCTNFHLLIGIAILDDQMDCFIENEFGFTEILKHVNELSEKMNLKEILEYAESIYYQIKNAPNLNDRIRVIIGEEPLSKNMDDEIYDSASEKSASLEKEDDEEFERKLEENCDNAMKLPSSSSSSSSTLEPNK